MECNKDEAVRAKDIAEKKMTDKDYLTARKMVLKAQKLYKDLENISQMLVICDVHCSADQKLFGKEMDWYGILQIEHMADEAAIKRQYRKLALQLHPDKNKFPGAEAAFKLIGEAQRVLLDKEKRSLYDCRLRNIVNRPAAPNHPLSRATGNSKIGVQNYNKSNFTGFNPQSQQTVHPAAQKGFSNVRLSFLTACPSCGFTYQYFLETVNKPILCPRCGKPFIAYESPMQRAPTVRNVNQPPFHQKMNVPDQSGCKVEAGATVKNVNQPPFHQKVDVPDQSGWKVEGRATVRNVNQPPFHQKVNAPDQSGYKGEGRATVSNVNQPPFDQKMEVPVQGGCKVETGVPANVNADHMKTEKLKRKTVIVEEEEPTESCDSESSNDTEEDIHIDEDGDFKVKLTPGYKVECPRRSDRFKQKVSYKENLSDDDDDFVNSPKQDHKMASFSATKKVNGIRMDENVSKKRKRFAADTNNQNEVKKVETLDGIDDSDAYSDSSDDIKILDSEFFNFDSQKSFDKFQPGQIWSLYCDEDQLPKYFGKITSVSKQKGMRLRLRWLESKETRHNNQIPPSCGNFKIKKGTLLTYESADPFSHQVTAALLVGKDEYLILPRKGEVWALYKDWSATLNDLKNCEYEVVVVDEENDLNIKVLVLERVNGHNAVFRLQEKGVSSEIVISNEELFKFSHQIPAHRLTNEGDGSLSGCWEIDSAAMPVHYFSKTELGG